MHRKAQPVMMLPEESHAYGKKNRPGTPVGDVVSNYYGQKAEELAVSKADYLVQAKKPMGLNMLRAHTRASAMAQNAISESEWHKTMDLRNRGEDMFKMRKFKNIAARTNTYNYQPKKLRV